MNPKTAIANALTFRVQSNAGSCGIEENRRRFDRGARIRVHAFRDFASGVNRVSLLVAPEAPGRGKRRYFGSDGVGGGSERRFRREENVSEGMTRLMYARIPSPTDASPMVV